MKLKLKSWKDVSIKAYYQIVDVLNDEELSETEKDIKILSVLCDVDESAIWDLEIVKIKELMQQAQWLNNFTINEKAKYTKIVLNEQVYTIERDLQKFTAAQYIDFQTFWNKHDLKTYMGNILACFIIPKGKKYAQDYDVADLAATIQNELDIQTAQEILFFSRQQFLNFMKASQVYLKLQTRKMKHKLPKEQYLDLLVMLTEKWNNIINGLVA